MGWAPPRLQAAWGYGTGRVSQHRPWVCGGDTRRRHGILPERAGAPSARASYVQEASRVGYIPCRKPKAAQRLERVVRAPRAWDLCFRNRTRVDLCE